MVNARYFARIQAKLASLISKFEDKNDETQLGQERILLLKSMSKWMEDETVLNGYVHISSLAPVYLPSKLSELVAGRTVRAFRT
jgi:molybdopterin converting factor small subunit